jgi:hypothetical protein
MADSRVIFQDFLASLGLGHMSDLINKAITESMDPATFSIFVENDPRFLAAFPEIAANKAKLAQGEKVQAIKAVDVINYRTGVKSLFRDMGLPPTFYDQPEDFVDLMVNKNLSLAELESRVEQGFSKVDSAPPEVQDVFNSFFGAQGKSALAAIFLDPARGTKALGEMVAQAEIGGAGKRFGFDVDVARAERLRESGIADYQRAAQGFEQAGQLRPLEQETISEATDITEEELVEGAFGTDQAGLTQRERLQRRAQERTAAFQGGGGAQQGQSGFGLGSAR